MEYHAHSRLTSEGAMVVAVLGDDAQAWLVAAHASASMGEPVRLVADGAHSETVTFDVAYADAVRPARVVTSAGVPDDVRVGIVAATQLDRGQAILRRSLAELSSRMVVLAPGGAGGAVRAADAFAAAGLPTPVVGELTGFPVLGSIDGRAVTIRLIKRHLPLGVLRATDTSRLAEALAPALPDVVPAANVLATSLANTNTLVHPPLALLNVGRIEDGRPYRFYREAVGPGAARLIRAIDDERLRVTDALGLEHVSVEGWFGRFYGDQGMAGEDIGTMLHEFGPLGESLGPTTLDHRYIRDDVTYGLAVIEAVGRRLGHDLPVTTSVCTALSHVAGVDLRAGADEIARACLDAAGPPAVHPSGTGGSPPVTSTLGSPA